MKKSMIVVVGLLIVFFAVEWLGDRIDQKEAEEYQKSFPGIGDRVRAEQIGGALQNPSDRPKEVDCYSLLAPEKGWMGDFPRVLNALNDPLKKKTFHCHISPAQSVAVYIPDGGSESLLRQSACFDSASGQYIFDAPALLYLNACDDKTGCTGYVFMEQFPGLQELALYSIDYTTENARRRRDETLLNICPPSSPQRIHGQRNDWRNIPVRADPRTVDTHSEIFAYLIGGR